MQTLCGCTMTLVNRIGPVSALEIVKTIQASPSSLDFDLLNGLAFFEESSWLSYVEAQHLG